MSWKSLWTEIKTESAYQLPPQAKQAQSGENLFD